MYTIKIDYHKPFKDGISGKVIELRDHQIKAIKAVFSKIKSRQNGYICIAKGCGNSTTSFRLAQLLENKHHKVVYLTSPDILRKLPSAISFRKGSSLIKNFNNKNLICTTNGILFNALKKSRKKFNREKCIFIYDECRWACTNNKHELFKSLFNNSLFYGFTNSPIYMNTSIYDKTSKKIFSNELYSYNLKDALNDGYQTPFKIKYFNVPTDSKKRVSIVSNYIIRKETDFKGILITSQNQIHHYYNYFKENSNLKIATFYSAKSDSSKKKFKEYLEDYNKTFKTSFNLNENQKIRDHIFNNQNINLLIISYADYIKEIDLTNVNAIYFDKIYENILNTILDINNRCNNLITAHLFRNMKSEIDNNLKLLNENHPSEKPRLKKYSNYIKEFNKNITTIQNKLPSPFDFYNLKEKDKETISNLIDISEYNLKNAKTFLKFSEKKLRIGIDLFNKYSEANYNYKQESIEKDNNLKFKLVKSDLINEEYIQNLLEGKIEEIPVADEYQITEEDFEDDSWKNDALKVYQYWKNKDSFENESASIESVQNSIADSYDKNHKKSTKSNSEKYTFSKWKYSNWTKIYDEVKETFPFDKPRSGQLETISEIQHAINKGYKYIILEAGTGTGKSVIAATLAMLQGNSYILTSTKQLQKQYLKDFEGHGFKEVKGRQNFDCKVIKSTCKEGKCQIDDYNCPYGITKRKSDGTKQAYKYLYWKSSTHCNYYQQKIDGLNCPHIITNYAYALVELNNVNDFLKRDLLVLDEAHNVEDILMDFLTLEFEREELKENLQINLSKKVIDTLKKKGQSHWIKFAERILSKYNEEYESLSKLVKNSKKDLSAIQSKIFTLKDNIKEIEFFITQINRYPNEWVMNYDNRNLKLSFKPIKVDKYAKDFLFRYGNVCLFMSATILDPKQFSKWLGIKEHEIYTVRRKSPFNIKRHPIYTKNSVDMNYRKLRENAPSTIPMIKEILDKHSKDKGLIHSISYNCGKYIKNHVINNRLIIHDSKNREKIIKEFEETASPKVLISPSMNEGVDLPYDNCRFQIIYKIPYPNITDKQIEKRKDMDMNWYIYKTAISLLQTYGRGMRAEDDSCVTYIVDSRLTNFIYKNRRLIPDYFIDAIQN